MEDIAEDIAGDIADDIADKANKRVKHLEVSVLFVLLRRI